jgi:hypothetical protein
MISVGWLAPKGCWDQNMLMQLFDNQLYPTGIEFKHHDGFPNVDAGCVLAIPGKFWRDHVDVINDAISRYSWVLAVRVSDEEDWFDIKAVEHHNIVWWAQYARTDRDYNNARMLGVGYPPHFNKLPSEPYEKPIEVFLSAQNTHERRRQAFSHLKESDVRIIRETEGFTQGLEPEKYMYYMYYTKVAPAPSGAATPDSFRLYEALQAHCVPIADDINPLPTYDSRGYWQRLFPDAPFEIIEDYNELPQLIDEALSEWPANTNRVTAWWMRYKRSLAHALRADLAAVGAF